MKSKMMVLMGALVLGLGLVGTPASWAISMTSQDVTFDMTQGAGNTVVFTITNAPNATGDWGPATHLSAFAFKDLGGVTGMSLPNWSVNGDELNANGCTGGSSTGQFCFSRSPIALQQVMTFTISYTGTLDLTNPHLKIQFTDANGNKVGSLLSQNFNVPEPTSLMLLGAGLAGIGAWRRKSGTV